jgi:hypothetical protein
MDIAVMNCAIGRAALLADAVILLRDHPEWAVWLPGNGRGWTAIRPAAARSAAPELPTMWVQASTARELADLMEACDQQLAG